MNNETKTNWLERPIHSALPAITNEILVFAGILLFAVITRFYDLEARVMSHDESLHTYFSWLLYRGQGYQHTPMMHGPLQFHMLALSYFIFGVSDLTSRIAAVLFSIATVWMVWSWRDYLGKWGALAAGLMLVVSPYMLYYGRYVRNESFTGVAGLLLLYGILRYLEKGERRYFFFVTAGAVLHFLTKETSFIYAAQALLFLGFYFLARVTRRSWEGNARLYRTFIIALVATVLLGAIGTGFSLTNPHPDTLTSGETAAPANPTGESNPLALPSSGPRTSTLFFGLAAVAFAAAVLVLFRGFGWSNLLRERSFDLMILLLTFIIPQLSAFIIRIFETPLNLTIPTDTASVNALDARAIAIISVFVILLFVVAIALGMFWSRDWWKYGVAFWAPFTIFYTTVFTNAAGFFTGVIGSLGYWIVQQGVERGSQPEYYYILVQIPMYEFLPAIGLIVAIGMGIRKLMKRNPPAVESEIPPEIAAPPESVPSRFGLFFALLTWWSISSVLAFTIAGERMPWLTYHMAWPMILMTGWAIGQIIESTLAQLDQQRAGRAALAILVLAVFLLAAFNTMRALFGATPPFQGTELLQLQATASFLLPLVSAVLSGIFLGYLMKDDLPGLATVALFILILITFGSSLINGASLLALTSAGSEAAQVNSSAVRFGAGFVALLASISGLVYVVRNSRTSLFVPLAALTAFALLFVQTMRTSFRANYILYDDAMEYLVYAHAATGVKEVLTQVEEISERTAGGLDAVVAYDASAPDTGVSWPMVWYLRDFSALRSFDKPTRSLREAVAVVVDQKNFDTIDAALGDGFYRFDYIRMWWPNQDYFNLDRTRIVEALTNPQIREGIFDIWFDRDYTLYGQAIGSDTITKTNWQPADQMRLYVRKDVAAQIWNYGVGPAETTVTVDPYEAGTVILAADVIFNSDRYAPLGLNAPRAVAAGRNNDLYVADSRNHRILHIATDGTLLHEWGTFGDQLANPNLEVGFFNEPWGLAVGPDGSVYVTDTWNHRVQKFSEDGQPLEMWGQYGQPIPEDPASKSSFWGPRGIAVDSEGRVYVADTGNKRIVIFDADGNYLSEFGTAGFDPGQFDEPVGLAIADDGTVYVTDTWNQRIQSFVPSDDGASFTPLLQWDVNAWFGQSLDNKPFLAVDANGNVFITDPEGFRIIQFTSDGQFVRTWGDYGVNAEEIGLAAGVAVDPLGNIWVTDAGNNRILKYTLPQ